MCYPFAALDIGQESHYFCVFVEKSCEKVCRFGKKSYLCIRFRPKIVQVSAEPSLLELCRAQQIFDLKSQFLGLEATD